MKIVRLLALLAASAISVFAQSTTGDIPGTIQGSTGAVIPDAKVEAKNLDTNATKEETSSAEGTFRLSLSPTCRSDPGGVVTGNRVGTSIRPFLNTSLDLSRMTVRQIQTAGGGRLFRRVTALNPIGNAGRGILRADGINPLDFDLIKNARFARDIRSRLMRTSLMRRTRAIGAFRTGLTIHRHS